MTRITQCISDVKQENYTDTIIDCCTFFIITYSVQCRCTHWKEKWKHTKTTNTQKVILYLQKKDRRSFTEKLFTWLYLLRILGRHHWCCDVCFQWRMNAPLYTSFLGTLGFWGEEAPRSFTHYQHAGTIILILMCLAFSFLIYKSMKSLWIWPFISLSLPSFLLSFRAHTSKTRFNKYGYNVLAFVMK